MREVIAALGMEAMKLASSRLPKARNPEEKGSPGKLAAEAIQRQQQKIQLPPVVSSIILTSPSSTFAPHRKIGDIDLAKVKIPQGKGRDFS